MDRLHQVTVAALFDELEKIGGGSAKLKRLALVRAGKATPEIAAKVDANLLGRQAATEYAQAKPLLQKSPYVGPKAVNTVAQQGLPKAAIPRLPPMTTAKPGSYRAGVRSLGAAQESARWGAAAKSGVGPHGYEMGLSSSSPMPGGYGARGQSVEFNPTM